jgi:pSer/pThr/pTyr-binding forkhead associated (FHA) protein
MIDPVAVVDPVAVLLKFAFIAVLYLFLLWVARSALKDLRRPSAQAVVAEPAAEPLAGRGVLVVEGGGGLRAGASYVVDGSTTIGRSPGTDIQIEDPFASGRHARIHESGGHAYIEDMGSTNGTYLNGKRLRSEQPLGTDDRIRIGDTEFRYERQQ